MFSLFWPVRLAIALFKFFLNLVVFCTCVFTIMALMGDKGWLWSLTTHFRVQYLAIQSLALVLASLTYWKRTKDSEKAPARIDQWLSLVVLMFFTGLNLMAVLPYYLPASKALNSPAETRGRVKLMHFNLFGVVNRNYEAVINAIQDNNPDIVDLVEYTDGWETHLEQSGVFRKYPYRVAGRGHIGVYSKIPLQNAHLVFTSATHQVTNQANIVAQIKLGGSPVTLLVAHPASPIAPSHLHMLQQSFRVWERERRNLGKNLVIVGDLNTSPWSVEFKELTQKTALRDSQLGFGLQPSWPMLLPAIGIRTAPSIVTNLLCIPIDHVLVSSQVAVLSRQTGPFIGSDHLPVVIELGMKASP